MKKPVYLKILLTLGLIFLCGLASPGWSKEVYKIAGVFPRSGPFSFVGISQERTFFLLAELINKGGGINGHPLKTLVIDSRGDPKGAIKAAKKLIQEKVNAAIGFSTTPETLVIMSMSGKAGVPIISCAPGLEITQLARSWVFQSAPRYTLRIDKALKDIRRQGFSRISLNGPTGYEKLPSYVTKKARKLGIKIIDDVLYDHKATEDEKISKYSQINVSTQAVLNYDPRMKLSSKKWNEILRKRGDQFYVLFPMINRFNISPSFPKQESIKLVTPTFLFPRFWSKGQQNRIEKLKSFSMAYMKKYGDRIHTYDFAVHDAFMIIVEALRQVGADKKSIRDYIENLRGFPGITGTFKFSATDHNGLFLDVFKVLTVNKDNGCPDDLHHCSSCICADSEKDCYSSNL